MNTAKRRRFADICSMAAGTALIVTAHPDDEAMFFGPTIQRLQREGTRIHVLCLSTGMWIVQLRTHETQSSAAYASWVCMCALIIAQGTLRDLAACVAMSCCVHVKCLG